MNFSSSWRRIGCLLTTLHALPSLGTAITSSIKTADGVINGLPRDSAGIVTFLGIPYAAPPVNELRWKPPHPVAPHLRSTIAAIEYGNSCWSSYSGQPTYRPQDEDCLTVNVWTGALHSTDKLPVMVWIYGGGFQFGASADPSYNGTSLATQGVVLVSFNYRLAALGFLALPELDCEGSASGNFGLQDQIAALKWIKANIAPFGGDPDNITIFGQSAGAHSVGILVASPLAHGLFNKAILESGAWWDSEHGSLNTYQQARTAGLAFQKTLGAKDITGLRKLSAATIMAANIWDPNSDPALTSFSPSIDNYVLPATPGTIFARGEQAKIPLLAGWTSEEETLFLGRSPPTANPAYQQDLKRLFNSKISEALILYPGSTSSLRNTSAAALIGDFIIRQQTWEAAEWQYKAHVKDIYIYYFTYTSPYSPVAAHTAELPFVFGNLELGSNPIFGGQSISTPSSTDIQFSKNLMTYWSNFAKKGNPNGSGVPAWPAYKGVRDPSDTLLLNNTIIPYLYDYNRFEFIKSFRRNGILPLTWREVDPRN
ncbi:hypothetical protein B7463_g11663, partial [Scytalidium lignicola]